MAASNVVSDDLVEEFRERLAEARQQLLRTVMVTGEELATLEPHQAGSLMEEVATEIASGILSRLEGREKHELDEIDAAQARLAAGAYGICARCQRPIPLARLRAVPVARHCVSCQAGDER